MAMWQINRTHVSIYLNDLASARFSIEITQYAAARIKYSTIIAGLCVSNVLNSIFYIRSALSSVVYHRSVAYR
jgi:hypothetical protein